MGRLPIRATRHFGPVDIPHLDDAMKSQSAMEYLMTYGWAILVIAVVLGVLFQLGVFNNANFAPRAQPGSCEVQQLGGGSSTTHQLAGMCQGELPKYVLSIPSNQAFNNNVLTSLNLNGITSLTITVWFNPQSTQPQPGGPDGGEGSPVGSTTWCPDGISIEYTITHQIAVETTMNPLDGAAPCNDHLIQTGTESPNQWYFAAAVYNGIGTALYVNGQYVTSTYPAASTNGVWYGGPFVIGNFGCTPCGNHPFNGTVSNVQLYNTSLSAAEVLALYQEGIGGAPVRPQNIVAWWPLNGNTNDYGGGNYNGQNNGEGYSGSWTNGYSSP